MKMSRATDEEIDEVIGFFNIMEALFESRNFFSGEESWRGWDDDDEDKKQLLAIEKELKSEWDDEADNRLVLYEFIKRKWKKINYNGSFGRVAMDAMVLIDNVCDKNFDYLEYKPGLKEVIEKWESSN